MIVEPASALPLIFTAVAVDGEAGTVVRPVGAAGGVVSLVKLTDAEHGEVLPAASVAVALQVLVALSAAVTLMPPEAKAAAVPVATALPEQELPA